MNRSQYFDFIEENLSMLATRIEMRGGLNLLDLHLHSENFYLYFFNILFRFNLQNINTIQKNAAGIDLVDTANKIIIQVSATATKQKIESALAKNLSIYKGYSFRFISISKDATALRKKKFSNPHNLIFSPADDIFDVPALLKSISDMEIDKLKEVFEFLKKELKSEPEPEKMESNLTTIINILSKEDWNVGMVTIEVIPFDIEAKISYNQLDNAKPLIDDYKFHYSRINKIYSEYDKQGVNKSLSILNGIRSEYVALCSTESPDLCFFNIIDKVIQKIICSTNYVQIPEEELKLCVQILVVDAFIRCKIFKNPQGACHAHP